MEQQRVRLTGEVVQLDSGSRHHRLALGLQVGGTTYRISESRLAKELASVVGLSIRADAWVTERGRATPAWLDVIGYDVVVGTETDDSATVLSAEDG